ncbi:hypothetical protein PYK79_25590 [Streptomyces sp. ID05-04B]|uniref:hypothetical protein n=1 Tax=unclassified Streptomyces TaxID=2593676 RepID=UPI000D19E6D0|nr:MULTISPECIES: hypothetical protein [unclassified Streptomyces]AVV44486.1 hypothetical protein C6376_26665 [Streptomyces sp. P3]MDX5566003.1 hypothetical protein [Streptomyces sp. ID05-04B]
MPAALRPPARSEDGATTIRLIPQDPEWLWDFFMTHDLLLAPHHAAWASRRHGVGEDIAPAWPPGLENLTGLDAPAGIDAWARVHHALPPSLRDRALLHDDRADPTRRSPLRAPDGRPLVPLHAVTVAEDDLRALGRVRRAIRAGARAMPSLVVTRHPDGSTDVHRIASPGDYRGTVDRTVAVLSLAPDDDTDVLAEALAPGTTSPRIDLSEEQYAAYWRFADRLAAAAMTGRSGGDRALFRSRY